MIELLRVRRAARLQVTCCNGISAEPLPPVKVDSIQIEQVLVNLIRNAIEAMAGNSRGDRPLLLRTEFISPDRIRVAVQDAGRGIDPGQKSRLFEPFFTTKSDGMGMGLAISNSIIQSHGGTLEAISNPDRGLTFQFTLPVFAGEEMPMEANQTPTATCSASSSSTTHPAAARVGRRARRTSHDVPTRTFASAAEFLASYEPSQRGCLVVDVRMTGMTGLELQQELSVRGYRIPVIVITGFADVPTAVRAMRAGAVTFLEKPCSDKELWASIETALQWEARSRQQRTQREDVVARRATLTPAEVQVLDRLIAGKANKAIAAELDLGLRTVELRRATIMKKMDANSLAELVRMILSIEGPSDATVSGARSPTRQTDASSNRT